MDNNHRFDISSAVVRQLGKELVSDEVTALIELAKNAYDADASYVIIIVDTNHIIQQDEAFFVGSRGIISIEDDGIGMDEEELRKGWLTISLSAKREMKRLGITTKRGRTPLGDKGLGRLSTQRLGYGLDLVTRKAGSDKTYHLAFNWEEFREDVPLSSVPIYVYEGNSRKKGTKLIISNLINPSVWAGTSQTDLIKKLSQLIFPFSKGRSFRISMSINGKPVDLQSIAESVREAAIARFKVDYQSGVLTIHGKIRLSKMRTIGQENIEAFEKLLLQDNGNDFFNFLTSSDNKNTLPYIEYSGDHGWFITFTLTRTLDDLGGVARINRNTKSTELGLDRMFYEMAEKGIAADPGNFTSEFDEFTLRNTDFIGNDSVFDRESEFTEFIKSHAGIRIFRDGFGIRPYGLQGYDWLNLGGGQTSGRSFYGLRPQNIIGYVSLSESDNYHLREKTDREGFLESPYSQNFFLLMREAVRIVNLTYNNLRRSYNEYRQLKSTEITGYGNIKKPLSEMRDTSLKAESLERQTQNLEQKIIDISQSIKSVTDRVDAGPIFAHPEENYMAPLLKDVHNTLSEARRLVTELQLVLPQARRLREIADYLEPKIVTLETQLEEFSELAGLGLTAEALSHEIHNVADRLALQTRTIIDTLKNRDLQVNEIVTFTEYVNSAVSALRKQLSHLSPSLRYVREKKEVISMYTFFSEMQEFYNHKFKSLGIKLILNEKFNDFFVKMNKGRLTQIIDNLILNSEYWLKHAIRIEKVEDAIITVSSNAPYIRIEDNGLGVDPSIERILFQPFVTTKPQDQGRGLGLFIVQQLLDSIGGTLSLLPQRNLLGRRYIFELDLTGVVHEH